MDKLRPSRADTRTKNLGKWLTGASLLNVCLLVVIAIMAAVIMTQTTAISALSTALSQQRSQFDTCRDKPAATRGCTVPVAAEPSVVVRQGLRGPIGLPGPMGASGIQGPAGDVGPQGPRGPAGPVGLAGKQGPPPGCSLLSGGCIGPQGPRGPQGPAGRDGLNGKDGEPGKNGEPGSPGKDGATGPAGTSGKDGRGIADTDCLADGSWRINYTDGTTGTATGPCRADVFK